MQREKIVRRKLADGTVKEYRYGPSALPTVGNVISEYKASSLFTKKAASTKALYLSALDRIGEHFHNVPIAEIRRRHILGHRDIYQETPGAANRVVSMWSVLLKFAIDYEYVAFNVAAGIKLLPIGEYKRWPEGAIRYALTSLAEHVRRAVVLALYTGQREGDVARMRWSDIEDDGINVVQGKTGAKLWVPAHKDLRAELEAWRKDTSTLTILSNTKGRPWSQTRLALAQAFGDERDRHPILIGLTFHGLRKSAAARLAEAGCTTHEIASITGHASLKEIERYTKEANQKTRAQAAILKLENRRK